MPRLTMKMIYLGEPKTNRVKKDNPIFLRFKQLKGMKVTDMSGEEFAELQKYMARPPVEASEGKPVVVLKKGNPVRRFPDYTNDNYFKPKVALNRIWFYPEQGYITDVTQNDAERLLKKIAYGYPLYAEAESLTDAEIDKIKAQFEGKTASAPKVETVEEETE